jgi:hypothetical protein
MAPMSRTRRSDCCSVSKAAACRASSSVFKRVAAAASASLVFLSVSLVFCRAATCSASLHRAVVRSSMMCRRACSACDDADKSRWSCSRTRSPAWRAAVTVSARALTADRSASAFATAAERSASAFAIATDRLPMRLSRSINALRMRIHSAKSWSSASPGTCSVRTVTKACGARYMALCVHSGRKPRLANSRNQ